MVDDTSHLDASESVLPPLLVAADACSARFPVLLLLLLLAAITAATLPARKPPMPTLILPPLPLTPEPDTLCMVRK
jgi:hypothetical protein